MAQPHPDTVQQLITRAQNAIEDIYPEWRVHCSQRGMWVASRIVSPTSAQSAAGVLGHIVRPSASDLGTALAQQTHMAA